MRVRRFVAKLGNMRKPADWIVYPEGTSADGTLLIQSDTRIARINPVTKTAVLSKAKPNGAYFMHLSPMFGATTVPVPDDVLALAREHMPKSGDEIGPGVFVA